MRVIVSQSQVVLPPLEPICRQEVEPGLAAVVLAGDESRGLSRRPGRSLRTTRSGRCSSSAAAGLQQSAERDDGRVEVGHSHLDVVQHRPGHGRHCRYRFGQVAVFEAGAGPDQGDEVGRVHRPPPFCTDSTILSTMASATVALPAHFVTLIRSRTVANGTRWGWWSAGGSSVRPGSRGTSAARPQHR